MGAANRHCCKSWPENYNRLRGTCSAPTTSIMCLNTSGNMMKCFLFIRDFKGDVPGASPKDCGNYLDMNLGMANYLANRYLENTLYHIDEKHLVYPE